MGISFELWGIHVFVSALSIILGLFLWLDALVYIKKMYPWSNSSTYPKVAVIVAFIAVISILMHEFGHAFVALSRGYSVNNMVLTGLGAYVELSSGNVQDNYISQIMISLAGPMTNLIIAALAAIPVWILGETLTENSIQYVSYINIRFARWNLYPILVLDGGKALDGIVRAVFGDSTFVTIFMVLITIITAIQLLRKPKGHREVEDALATL